MLNLSIVTICLNADKTIEKTFKSILEQKNRSFEYIIKDGKSIDNTGSIIERYLDIFEKHGVKCIPIIEEDQGIYDAMNQAVCRCNGKYVLFLNADDILTDKFVTEKLIERIELENVDVLYGDAIMKNKYEETIFKGNLELITKRMPFSHQASIYNITKLKKYMFDTHFNICGDYDLVLKIYFDGGIFRYIDIIISYYSMEGVSSKKYISKVREDIEILKKNSLITKKEIFRRLFEAYIKTFLDLYMPDIILRKLYHFYAIRIKKYERF